VLAMDDALDGVTGCDESGEAPTPGERGGSAFCGGGSTALVFPRDFVGFLADLRGFAFRSSGSAVGRDSAAFRSSSKSCSSSRSIRVTSAVSVRS
jgi:hypothetical protein